jgi:hypothetical protein
MFGGYYIPTDDGFYDSSVVGSDISHFPLFADFAYERQTERSIVVNPHATQCPSVHARDDAGGGVHTAVHNVQPACSWAFFLGKEKPIVAQPEQCDRFPRDSMGMF